MAEDRDAGPGSFDAEAEHVADAEDVAAGGEDFLNDAVGANVPGGGAEPRGDPFAVRGQGDDAPIEVRETDPVHGSWLSRLRRGLAGRWNRQSDPATGRSVAPTARMSTIDIVVD